MAARATLPVGRRRATCTPRMFRVFVAASLLASMRPFVPVVSADPVAAGSATVIGPSNPALADGATALSEGRIEDGIRLTLEGLRAPASVADQAAGHSNLCAGYAVLRRWDDALGHCERSLGLDERNWRTYNNRAAICVARGPYDRAHEERRRSSVRA